MPCSISFSFVAFSIDFVLSSRYLIDAISYFSLVGFKRFSFLRMSPKSPLVTLSLHYKNQYISLFFLFFSIQHAINIIRKHFVTVFRLNALFSHFYSLIFLWIHNNNGLLYCCKVELSVWSIKHLNRISHHSLFAVAVNDVWNIDESKSF